MKKSPWHSIQVTLQVLELPLPGGWTSVTEWWYGPFAKDKDTCIHLLSKNLLNICNVLHTAAMVEADRASLPRNFQNFLKVQKVKR